VRRAAVSSFGISGTNAHVVVEQPAEESVEAVGTVAREVPEGTVVPWVLSGRTPEAVAAQAAKLLEFTAARPETDVLGVARTLVTARTLFEHRVVVLGADRAELLAGLGDAAHGVPGTNVVSAPSTRSSGTTAFLFTGQGSQRLAMGAQLHEAFPVFAAAFDAVCAELDAHLARPIREVISGDAEALDRTEFAQPALFALEVALHRLVESWGVRPSHLAGHSIGEIAAAHVAGVLSLPDAAALVTARGRLMQALPAGGAMVAVRAPEDEVRELLAGREDRAGIAAVNGPAATVVSGEAAAVSAIVEELERRGRKTRALRVSHAFHSPLMAPVLDRFREALAGIDFAEPTIPLVSTLTGALAGPGDFTSVDYWVRHVREAVRFQDGVRVLEAEGVRNFLELGPDGVLTAMAADCLSDAGAATLLPVLRRERPENRTALDAVARSFVRGTAVDWTAVLADDSRRTVELPTYAFQHERYWMRAQPSDGDVELVGFDAVRHPLLSTAVPMPDGGVLLTGRLSVRGLDWAEDHVVGGTVLVPGTALLEMAVRAGEQVGCDRVDELVLREPVVLPAERALDVQVQVGGPDDCGRRQVVVHSRPVDDEQWSQHATGVLAPAARPVTSPAAPAAWPPAGAEPVELDGFYEDLAARGLDYGPAFRGLRAAWRDEDEIFAEVELPASQDATRYLLHPALLDASLHPLVLGGLRLPFSWTGVEIGAVGASVLRMRLTVTGKDSAALSARDPDGVVVFAAEQLRLWPFTTEELRAIGGPSNDALFRVEWEALPPLPVRTPHPASRSVRMPALDADRPVAEQVRAALVLALDEVRSWLAGEQEPDARLVLLTSGAEDDPVQSAVWGLVRSAQTEHPGRVQLVDLDGAPESEAVLPAVLASGEPQVTVRAGTPHAPRLVRAATGAGTTGADARWSGSSLLVTGAGGVVGSALAKHAVTEHGVGHVVLTSRRGERAPGMSALVAELRELGASVSVEACDVADREQLARALARVPAEFPLRGVVHAAGVSRDTVFQALTSAELDAVLPSKVDAVANLDDLTRHLDLDWFVVCSSAAGWWGSAGQANYAAANASIDALVRRRRATGRHALSLAWGLWEERGELSGHLERADLARLARIGIVPLATADALAAFDHALLGDEAVVLPLRLNTRQLADTDSAPLTPLLRKHLRRSAKPVAGERPGDVPEVTLESRLAGKGEEERNEVLLRLVRDEVAAVLDHPDADAVDADRGLFDMGLDSLTSLELRNRVEKAVGRSLPPTVIFDHSTPGALAKYLRGLFVDEAEPAGQEFGRVAVALAGAVAPPSLEGTTVLLTGATGGLGRVFAEVLAGAGADLVLTGRNRALLAEMAEPLRGRGGGVLTSDADVTDRDALSRVVEEAAAAFGGVDVLINNAGVSGPVGPLWETDDDEWWQAMEVNLRGTVRACRAVLPGMVERRHGRIVNIVSSAGRHRWPHVSGYSVSKAAVIKVVDNLAPELEGSGVTAFSFHPGLVDVGITGDQLKLGPTGELWRDRVGDWLLSQRESGRFTSPQDAGAMLLRLVSGEADPLSGSYLTPDDDIAALLRARSADTR
jgi:acyl transferase domain-containing protein/NAD(P)-dependent dehydrogenase (short-subunit alcohol dehydrogenase family)/acyl carrier protein